jgi:organic radical activating enzyme
MKNDKFFPIKSATACSLKWGWSTIRLYGGTTHSCHRVAGTPITVDTFDTFHNTPKKISDRTLMLDGKWPTSGCEYCQSIEQAGGSSDRQFHLTIPNMSPPELEENSNAVIVSPTILEIFFDNTCNLKCVYCNNGNSSSIQHENEKFGRFEQRGTVIDNYVVKVTDIDALTDRLWEWMRCNGHTLKRFHVLGGEPFYQSQFDRCLEFFDKHPHPEIELNVISNLMVSSPRLAILINKIRELVKERKVKRFDLTASIDCFGAEQEYVRYGLDLQQWKENFDYVANQKWITLHINQTLSGLTIKTVPALLQYVNKFRSNRKIGHHFSLVVHPQPFLHPAIFGPAFFDADFDEILHNMPAETTEQQEARKYMLGIQQRVNSVNRSDEKIAQLGIYLDEIDRRRGLVWRNVFPWLAKEVDNVV